jgi:hypothetical protein
MRLRQIGEPLDLPAEIRLFAGRAQAEVAFGEAAGGIVGEMADPGDAGVILDGGAQERGMAIAGDAVRHRAGEADVRIEQLVSQDERAGAAGHRGGVEGEDDQGVQQLRHVRRGREIRVGRRAVVQPHHALDDRDIGVPGGARKAFPQPVLTHHPDIERPGRAAAGGAVIAGIEVVRADFEGCDAQAAPDQGGHQRDCERGLAGPRSGPGDDEGGDAASYHDAERSGCKIAASCSRPSIRRGDGRQYRPSSST